MKKPTPKPVKPGKPKTGIEAKRRAVAKAAAKMKKNPANYMPDGTYGFDGGRFTDPNSPRG